MRKVSMIGVAAAALLVSGPLLAQQGSNGQQTREQARENSQGPNNANQRGVDRSNENSVLHDGQSGGTHDGDMNGHGGKGKDKQNGGMQDHSGHDMQNGDMRRQNSQGSANASDRARERANANSAVSQGMEVRDERGRRVGQVREVKRATNGTVIAIVVVLVVQINNTNVITLPAGSFTIINNVVVINNINLNIGS
jgi:hypothetical protein